MEVAALQASLKFNLLYNLRDNFNTNNHKSGKNTHTMKKDNIIYSDSKKTCILILGSIVKNTNAWKSSSWESVIPS
jgi:hypothetical protein